MNDDIANDMVNFCNEIGLSRADKTLSTNISEIISKLDEGLNGRTTEEIESLLMKIHAFNLDLKNKKSSLKSFITIREQQVNRYVSEKIDDAKDKYSPFEFKKESIISQNSDVSRAYRDLMKSKSQLEKIGDIPFSLDKVIMSIESYMKRRYSQ